MAWAEPAGKGRWRGRYRDQNGQTKDAGYAGTKKKAERLGQDQEAKIRQGTWFDPTAGKVTFSEYFENQWIVNRTFEVSPRDYYWSMYRAALKPEFGDVQLRRILASDVQGWVARMHRSGVTPATIRHRVKALQTVLAARRGASALRDKLIQFNPVAGVELPFVPDPEVEIYTPDETDALLEEMDPWWRLIPLFAVETGCRWGEVMGVSTDDFGFGYTSVTIRRTILERKKAETGNGTRFMWKDYPKGKKHRTVGLSPEVSTAVRTWIADLGLGPGDRLFSMPDISPPREWHPPLTLQWEPLRTPEWPVGVPISRSFFRSAVWLPAIRRAKVPERTFHALRASHISWLLSDNVDLPAVMLQVGHTQFQTTRRYTAALGDVDHRVQEALAAVRSRYRP